MRSKVSIVVPTRNRSALLRQALRSVRAQTWPEREVVVIDEASTDDTQAVLATEFPEARVVRHDVARGPGGARNAGIRATDGDWVFFWDDDDLMHPSHLAGLVEASCAAPPNTVVSGRIRSFTIERDEVRLAPIVVAPENRPGIETIAEFIQPHGRGTITQSTTLWPRRLFDAVMWDESLYINEDVDFFGRAILTGLDIIGRPVGMHYMRYHSGPRLSTSPSLQALLGPSLYRLKWSELLVSHPRRELCATDMRNGLMATLIDLTGVSEAQHLMPRLDAAFHQWGGKRYYVTPPPGHPLKRFLAQTVLDVAGLPGLRRLLDLSSQLKRGEAEYVARLQPVATDTDRSDAATILAAARDP